MTIGSKMKRARQDKNEFIVGLRYRLKKKIGGGSFGTVFLAEDIKSGYEVAIKMEKKGIRHPQLQHECHVMRSLQNGTGVPKIQWYGEERGYNVLVMSLVGPSLEDMFNYCTRRFSLKTVLLLGYQMITRVEYLHTMRFVHRDIKPDNFAMGMGPNINTVYLLDYGLATRYLDAYRNHIPYNDESQGLIGTARYISRNAIQGMEQSRRDDVEALTYVLLYFLRGSLPWQNLKASTKQEKFDKIKEKKLSTSVEELCDGCPTAFSLLVEHVRGLHFMEVPDYDYIRSLITKLMTENKYVWDNKFDWNVMNPTNAWVSPHSRGRSQRDQSRN